MSKRVRITIPTMTDGGRSGFRVENLDAFVDDFKKLPKDIQAEIRKGAKELIKPTVVRAKELAAQGERQQTLFRGKTIYADFYLGAPAIVASGTQRLNPRTKRRRKRPLLAGDLFAGAEFGSNKYKQFPKRTARLGVGNAGSFFFPAIREMDGKKLMKEYLQRIDNALRRIVD